MPRIISHDSVALPDGFSYWPGFLSNEEEQSLLACIRNLEFRAYDYHGYTARRRIVDYGLTYDFASHVASPTTPIPEFLLPFRERAAYFAEVAPQEFVEAIVTEYSPGSPIGWHRDAPQFGIVFGISLLSSCRFRFKPYRREGKIVTVSLEPRSAYLMRGAARWQYQHSIPAVKELRFSITFRTAGPSTSKKTATEKRKISGAPSDAPHPARRCFE
jgi:alkylated DNA repair dioxygenase AlkB